MNDNHPPTITGKSPTGLASTCISRPTFGLFNPRDRDAQLPALVKARRSSNETETLNALSRNTTASAYEAG